MMKFLLQEHVEMLFLLYKKYLIYQDRLAENVKKKRVRKEKEIKLSYTNIGIVLNSIQYILKLQLSQIEELENYKVNDDSYLEYLWKKYILVYKPNINNIIGFEVGFEAIRDETDEITSYQLVPSAVFYYYFRVKNK